MPRRPFPSCDRFLARHVDFVDQTMPADELNAMQRHREQCPACAGHDVRVRRSLMALQALPRIIPTARFRAELRERLAGTMAEESRTRGSRVFSGSIRRVITA